MPRISRELAAQKEAFVVEQLTANPALTLREVTEAVKTKFGASMNAVKIAELRAKVTGVPVVVAVQTPTEPQPVPEVTVSVTPEPTVEPALEAPAPILAVPTEPVVPVAEPVAIDKTTVVEPVVTTYTQTTTLDENGRPVNSIRPGTVPEVTGAEVEIRPGLTEIVANG